MCGPVKVAHYRVFDFVQDSIFEMFGAADFGKGWLTRAF